MAPLSLTVERVDAEGATRTVYFSDDTSLTFATVAEAQDFVDQTLGAGGGGTFTKAMIVAQWLENSPTLSNDNVIEGFTYTLDARQNSALLEKS